MKKHPELISCWALQLPSTLVCSTFYASQYFAYPRVVCLLPYAYWGAFQLP